MSESGELAARFEEHRPHLRRVAHRMLGSLSEADDAVQEAWIRLSRSDISAVANLGGWLTTVLARTCLDLLRARASRREESLEAHSPEAISGGPSGSDAEREALLADSVGLALLVILEKLAPAERVAFVLHDMFAVPFDDIATILNRTPMAARQLASRARRRVQGTETTSPADRTGQQALVDAFLAASREGDFEALLAVLAPEVVLRADAAAVAMGAAAEVHGAAAVAATFKGRAQVAQLALINGVAGLVWAPGGQPRVVFNFSIESGKVVTIHLVADPEQLALLKWSAIDG